MACTREFNKNMALTFIDMSEPRGFSKNDLTRASSPIKETESGNVAWKKTSSSSRVVNTSNFSNGINSVTRNNQHHNSLTGKRIIPVRQGNHHKRISRPNMQMAGFHHCVPIGIRWDVQLEPRVGDILLLKVYTLVSLKDCSHLGVNTVASDD
jgi:hypothetical protein